MSDDKSLVPVEEKKVDFYGDEITAVLVDVDGRQQVYIPLKPICDFLGLNWDGQRQRIRRDAVLSEVVMSAVITTADIDPASRRPHTSNMLCLPLDFLNGFLFGVNASRVKAELRERLIRYQKECYQVLANAFVGRAPVAETTPTMAALAQIREMGLAIVQMAEQQMAFERRITATETRLENAAVFFGELRKRVTNLERQLAPGDPITDEQAAEIAQKVKAVAMAQGGQGDSFQAIWGELYRRFRVTSYKLIPQSKYTAVIAFLDGWLEGGDS